MFRKFTDKKHVMLWSMLILVLIMVFSFSACTQDTDTSTTAAETSAAETGADTTAESVATQEPSGIASLTYWTQAPDPVIPSYNDCVAFQIAQQETGIEVEFLHPAAGQEQEQYNLMIASNDLPDMILCNWETYYPGGSAAAVNDGVIFELTDVIPQKMPNLNTYFNTFPDMEKMSKTDDGKFCVVPCIYSTSPEGSSEDLGLLDREPYHETYLGLTIRQDWLEQLSLSKPVTLDDWYDMLTAFKDDMGAEAPLCITLEFLKTTQAFASAYDIAADWYVDDNQTVHYGFYEAAYKDYLTYLNRLYENGLLDKDFAVIDNSAMSAKVLSSEAGAWSGYTSIHLGVFHDQLHAEDPDTTFYPIGIANPVSYEGQVLKYRQGAYPYIPESCTGISKSCEDIDAAARFLDYGWSEEGNWVMNWGPAEDGCYVIKDGWPAWSDLILNDENYSPTQAYQKYVAYRTSYCIDHWTRLLSKGSYSTPESINALNTWTYENGVGIAGIPPISLTDDEQGDYADSFSEIKTYVDEMYTKFIMGEAPLTEFDTYIDNLNNMGMQEVISINQTALERYYNR